MTKEFNLSDKIYKYSPGAERCPDTIAREYVKEFIKEEEFLLIQVETKEITWKEFYKKLDKLVGEELK